MTDPQLPADQEARLRRLLADARHTAPVPDDVVSRLDEVLARLAAEEPHESRPDPVVVALDDARRRTLRRRVAGGLLAAAALVVGGVTVPQLLGSMGGSGEDAATAGEAAGPAESQADSPVAPGAKATFPAVEDLQGWDAETPGAYAALDDLDALRREADSGTRTRLPCLDTRWGSGRKVPIVFGDGSERQRGVAVVRAPGDDGDRQVDLYVCGRDEPVGSVVLPMP